MLFSGSTLLSMVAIYFFKKILFARERSKIYKPRIRRIITMSKSNPLKVMPTNIYLGGKTEVMFKGCAEALLSLPAEKLPGKVYLKNKFVPERAQYHSASEAESFNAGNNNGS